MTDAVPYRRTDLMGGQDEPSDLMERGREPAGAPDLMGGPNEPSDILDGGREPAGDEPDVLRAAGNRPGQTPT
jgi:hypothetical protein